MENEGPALTGLDSLILRDLSQTCDSEKCLGELRWKNGVLQQAWEVVTYGPRGPIKRETDWRDVPTYAEPAREGIRF